MFLTVVSRERGGGGAGEGRRMKFESLVLTVRVNGMSDQKSLATEKRLQVIRKGTTQTVREGTREGGTERDRERLSQRESGIERGEDIQRGKEIDK